MEIRDIFTNIKKNQKILIYSAFLGLIAGLLASVLPPRYISSGSLFVGRSVEESKNYFTYEGYYAQQSALGFTDSAIAVIRSPDLIKLLLEKTNTPQNTANYRKISKSISIKKTGPQIILVGLKSDSSEKSKSMWLELNNILIDKINNVNQNADDKLSINTLSEEPLIRESYRNIFVFSFMGLIFGAFLGLFLISLKEYFRY